MSTQVVSGRTRGEHGRGLDLEKITNDQGYTFVCAKVENLLVLLGSGRNYAIDGKVITEPDRYAQFSQHRYATKNEEIADLIRASSPFKKGIIKELAQAKAESKAEKEARVKALIDSDPELKKALVAQLTKDSAKDEPTATKRTKGKGSKKDAVTEPETAETSPVTE